MHAISTLLLAVLPAVLGGPVITKREDAQAETVEGKWLAKLNPDAHLDDKLVAKVKEVAGIDLDTNKGFDLAGFKGFAFDSDDDAKIDLLSDMGALATVEPAKKMWLTAPHMRGARGLPNAATNITKRITQDNGDSIWGLDRISHRVNRYDGPYGAWAHSNVYVYDQSAGAGTYVYVIDSGIMIEHGEFEGRASHGVTFVPIEGDDDLVGHGTHVAGTIGGKTYGVAKKTNIIAVKVFDNTGYADDSVIIQGMDWVYQDAKKKGRLGKSVVNMSLGGDFSQTMNDAAKALAASGIFVVVAAGNDGQDAKTHSPASEPTVCTIGATDYMDYKADFSNFGPLVDIFAPGVDVTSAFIYGDILGEDFSYTMSGTSMASPHVAGLGAYLMALEKPKDGKGMCDRIKSLGTKGKVLNQGAGSTRMVAFNGVYK